MLKQKKIELTLYLTYRDDADEELVNNGAIADDLVSGIHYCDKWYDISKIKITEMKRVQDTSKECDIQYD